MISNNPVKVIDSLCVKNKKVNREAILKYEEFAKTQPQVDIPVTHHIHGGMYGREITIPKGTILTGQIYKFDHFDIMLGGDITVSTDGDAVKRLTGVNVMKGLSGKKRAGYAHEDTRWITFHPFVAENGDDIQDYVTVDSFEELEQFYIDVNRSDYMSMVDEFGLSHDEIDSQVHNQDDMVYGGSELSSIKIKESSIHGLGLFSAGDFNPGDFICRSRIGQNRTVAGRYANHSVMPNAAMVVSGGDIALVSIKPISAGDEITVNYRDVICDRYLEGDLCQE